MPSLTIISRDAEQYDCLVKRLNIPDLTIYSYKTSDEAEEVSFRSDILLADPGLVIRCINQFKALKWMQSTWAGNAPLLQTDKCDYRLTGVKGVFGEYMREFVFAYLLYFSRNIQGFSENQIKQNWPSPPFTQLKGKTLGLLGVGSIGEAVAKTAKHFNMRVIAITRSHKENANIDHFYSQEDKCLLAQEADYLVSTLPDTPDTKHFIDAMFLANVKPQSIMINVGRGATIDEQALIQALMSKKLKAAVLDVFETEPLAKEHPFWTLENVFVTNHTAAVSYPEDIIDLFTHNYQQFINNKPLKYELSFKLGY
jgi:phosphoglycerate dehydrogenase-like enzyme